MQTIIAGSRSFNDYERLLSLINALPFWPSLIISGLAKGADQLGLKFAYEYDVPVQKYPADWKRFGKQAGFIRNREMAQHADVLVAFWDGESRGTAHMIKTAKKQGVRFIIVDKFKEGRKDQ